MRVSYEWLGTMVELPDDPKELVAQYTRTGTEVEAVEEVGASLANVVTGRVLTKEAHPDSDHMWVTTVDVGSANLGADGERINVEALGGTLDFVLEGPAG